MKILVTKTYNFDMKAERARLIKCFTKRKEKGVLRRQLAVLNAFESGDIKKFVKLYNRLPYNLQNECPEQEYIGMAILDFIRDANFNQFDKIEKIIK